MGQGRLVSWLDGKQEAGACGGKPRDADSTWAGLCSSGAPFLFFVIKLFMIKDYE